LTDREEVIHDVEELVKEMGHPYTVRTFRHDFNAGLYDEMGNELIEKGLIEETPNPETITIIPEKQTYRIQTVRAHTRKGIQVREYKRRVSL